MQCQPLGCLSWCQNWYCYHILPAVHKTVPRFLPKYHLQYFHLGQAACSQGVAGLICLPVIHNPDCQWSQLKCKGILMGAHKEYKNWLTRFQLVSIPAIILLIVHLSLEIKKTAECIWDICHSFSNVPGFPMGGYEPCSLFLHFVLITMYSTYSTLLSVSTRHNGLTRGWTGDNGGTMGGQWGGVPTVKDGKDESEKVCKSGPWNVDIVWNVQSSGIWLTVQSSHGTLRHKTQLTQKPAYPTPKLLM